MTSHERSAPQIGTSGLLLVLVLLVSCVPEEPDILWQYDTGG